MRIILRDVHVAVAAAAVVVVVVVVVVVDWLRGDHFCLVFTFQRIGVPNLNIDLELSFTLPVASIVFYFGKIDNGQQVALKYRKQNQKIFPRFLFFSFFLLFSFSLSFLARFDAAGIQPKKIPSAKLRLAFIISIGVSIFLLADVRVRRAIIQLSFP